MNFDTFMEKVKLSLQEFFGANAEICIGEVEKNNGVILYGLTIAKGSANISPTIYLEEFYREYKQGKDFGVIIYEIVKIYDDNKIETKVNLDFFSHYETVKDRIFFRVINYEKNKKRLQKIPYIRFHDLAVVCYFAYMNDLIGHGFIQIESNHLEKWGISQERLFADARKNTKNKLRVEIKGMNEIIWEMMEEKVSRMDIKEVKRALEHAEKKIPMYVMTLKGKYFGAACICQNEALIQFAEKVGKSFFILPSSIHELILIPDEGRETPEGLKKMVREVNRSHVAVEEQLSDNVYYFEKESETVIML